MMVNFELFEKAYKKLKSSVYFDRTQLPLRNKLVQFENRKQNKLDDFLDEMCEKFLDKNDFNILQQEILDSINFLALPKNLVKQESDIILNFSSEKCEVEEVQYFIDMKIEGHILGVLWLMMIGYKIDKNIYEHSYGNRIRKNLINEFGDNPTYSPYLFEPYFEQYESWRDIALTKAIDHLKINQDVVVMTMDFQRFYYSVDINRKAFDKLLEDAEIIEDKELDLFNRINSFVYEVIHKYSDLFSESEFNKRDILPIGFLPSNIIANWYLKKFDKAIVDGWNPIYYGRYVDDILIIDKVEHNSDICKKAQKGELTKESIVNFFLTQCSKWKGLHNYKFQNSKSNCDNKMLEVLKITTAPTETNNVEDDSKNDIIYHVNPIYMPIQNSKADITLQNKKLKIFYFKSGQTDALIRCFKENVSKNKSEFRSMPEDDAVFKKSDYTEIYTLKNDDTINKFRGVDGISLDKFNFSKFLGKYLRIGSMIEDKAESNFENDILKIFNEKNIIENYLMWEKIIEIFVINERFLAVKQFTYLILTSIYNLAYKKETSTASIDDIKFSLILTLNSALWRTFSLVYGPKADNVVDDIYNKIYELFSDIICSNDIYNLLTISLDFKRERRWYHNTRMSDKYVMPIMIDIIDYKSIEENTVNLTKFYEVIKFIKTKDEDKILEYKYHPYIINMYDISIMTCITEITKEKPFYDLQEIAKKQNLYYSTCNYQHDSTYHNDKEFEITKLSEKDNCFKVSVGNDIKKKLKVAVANTKLNHDNFVALIKGTPNRGYERYRAISTLVNQAIKQKVDILIMPESFVPFEWLATLARTCAKNNIAVVTGVEHIIYDKRIFNFTSVILPYKYNSQKCAYISFHLKKHYAPSEIQEIRGYSYIEAQGNNYELYKWNDFYFPVYCCFELTSISDRALFQSYADAIVAVEWNRDVKYYSNILESLSRDLHCYCIQVNSSDYGDSRITKPSKSEEKDIIRIKGGKNNTILTDEIDIENLRNFQIKGYELQKSSGIYKITPPEFNREIVMKKIKGSSLN